MDLKVILLFLSISVFVSNVNSAVVNMDLLGKDLLTRTKKIGLNLKDALDKLDPLKILPVLAADDNFIDYESTVWCGSWSCKTYTNQVNYSFTEEKIPSEENSSHEGHFSRHLINNELMSVTEEHEPEWTHEEQHDWYIKYPACGGVNQSPIDLDRREASIVRNGDCLRWSNYLDNRHLILNNTGHTIEARSTFENFFPLPTLEGGPLHGVYNFASMHWHWGSNNREGSEHTFKSKSYPIELHIIHYNSKFSSLTEAVTSGEGDALAVVGILFELSVIPTPGMTSLTRSMLRAREQGTQRGALPLGQLGLGFLDGFYSYKGSLTTPPCYPIVRWIVMAKPLPITKHDLKVFQAVKVDGHSLVDNYRKVQPINDRKVRVYNTCNLHH